MWITCKIQITMDLVTLWKNTVSEVEVDLGKTQTTIHFKNTNLSLLENGIAKITTPNIAVKDALEKKYYTLIQNALQHQTTQKLSLLFEVIKNEVPKPSGPLFDIPQSQSQSPITSHQSSIVHDDHYKRTGLNPKYTFKNLVVGSSNNFAHAAGITISKNPGREYNPFFIYGGVGIGKTHLMQAVGNELYQKNPDFKIFYVSAENFMNDLVAALQNKNMPAFKKKYREVDVLLIDDVQFVSGKESFQEEFFHTFNTLFMAEKQIILTSDRPPEEIKVEDRLLSRLMGGLAADIQTPDLEMRMAIINQKLEARSQKWNPEVVEFLASHFESNVREIEGALQKILAQSLADNISVDINLARTVLNGSGHPPEKTYVQVNPKKVIAAVSKIMDIKQSDILSDSRSAEFVLPRQIAMFLLRKEQQMGLEETAAALNRKDHTTVIHAVKKIEALFATNPRIKQQILSIKKELWG